MDSDNQFPISLDAVRAEMLCAEYWIAKLTTPNELLMNGAEIEEYNSQYCEKIALFVDLHEYPLQLSQTDLLKKSPILA
ncbi:MAG TPA: hypothetical protein EYH12_05645 [Psychromonas hadalis]|nr:hypothetical protein [Psychromonas hadalis]